MSKPAKPYKTTITLPPSLVKALDDLMPLAMDRKLVGRSAVRNDLIRWLLQQGVRELAKGKR